MHDTPRPSFCAPIYNPYHPNSSLITTRQAPGKIALSRLEEASKACNMRAYANGDSTMKQHAPQESCPCGTTQPYEACCGPYLSGELVAGTAEQLMRSRYCGFVYRNEDYLLTTWHPQTRPSRVRFDERQHWLGLSIRETHPGSDDEREAFVEFIARFKVNGKGHRLHENSRFKKIDGIWYYVNGEFL